MFMILKNNWSILRKNFDLFQEMIGIDLLIEIQKLEIE
jgi:hypothetical protein